ncbi:MAG TPA: pyruvate kinase [Burkholderiaceae bacterium]|jgi:pyruvate kinase
MQRSTKIVATVGPASSNLETLSEMIRAGVNVVRLNFSHGEAQDHIDRAALVRQAAAACGREIAIMADLQGPKIRIGKFEYGKIILESGNPFILDATCDLGNEQQVGLDYKELPRDLKARDVLLLNDGLIVLVVEKVVGSAIHTLVKIGGELSNNKGINRLGGGLSASALTSKDMEDIKTAMGLCADYVAVSFPKSASDMITARQLANIAGEVNNHRPMMIAKIERAEAIPVLQEILDASDGLMVARGDLAVEVGNAAVPALQKRMIKMARASNKLAITATQMMESMIVNAIPTRAEVSDVANAVLDGTDAVMTSAETASGRYPVETVEAMAAICLEAEKTDICKLDTDFLNRRFARIDQSIAYGALFTAHHLQVKAIIALTESASTVLWMSRHNINIPIFALTPNLATRRRAALYRNVTTFELAQSGDRDAVLQAVQELLLAHRVVVHGDLIVITWGEPMGQIGGTNSLKIMEVTKRAKMTTRESFFSMSRDGDAVNRIAGQADSICVDMRELPTANTMSLAAAKPKGDSAALMCMRDPYFSHELI